MFFFPDSAYKPIVDDKNYNFNIFKELKQRELSSKKIDVSYIVLFDPVKDLIDHNLMTKLIENIDLELSNLKPYSIREDAENAAVLSIQTEIKKYPYPIFAPKFLKQGSQYFHHKNTGLITKDDLVKNAYWIITLNGKTNDIEEMLSTDHEHSYFHEDEHYKTINKRVICAENNENTILVAREIKAQRKERENQKRKRQDESESANKIIRQW